MSDVIPHRRLGATDLRLSILGFGTMAIGGQYTDVDETAATATIEAARAAGITFFDTAPQYGCGLAEVRLARALATDHHPAAIISSKVGKAITPLGSGGQPQRSFHFPGGNDAEMTFDFSYDGTLRIVDDSLRRLGRSRIDMLLIHDVTRHFHGEDGIEAVYAAACDGALRALHRLRDDGIVRAIGIGLKDTDIAMRFIDEGDIDVALVPGRLTLLDQTAVTSGLLDLCLKHGVGFVAAAPFDSGVLATGAVPGARSAYRAATPELLSRVTAMERVCSEFGVSLQAAALQYPLRHSAVASVLAGMKTSAEVTQNVRCMTAPVSAALWPALAETCGVLPLGDD